VQEGARGWSKTGVSEHGLTENTNGLVDDVQPTQASGRAEGEAAEAMSSSKARWRLVTLGADRGYDTRGFASSMWNSQRAFRGLFDHRASTVGDGLALSSKRL
jgi:hypothetical protein